MKKILVLCLFLWGLFSIPSSVKAQQPTALPQHLLQAKPFKAAIKRNERHKYLVTCAAGEWLKVVARQIEADVELRVLEPQGPVVAISQYRPTGDEAVSWVAAKSGEYVLEVKGFTGTTPRIYEIHLVQQRPATLEEREKGKNIALACQMAFEAEKLIEDGKWEASVSRLWDSLPYSQAAGDFPWQARTWWAIGSAYSFHGDPNLAFSPLEKALQAARSAQDQFLEGDILYFIGDALNTIGQYRKSIECFDQARALAQKTGSIQHVSTCLISAGESWFYLGNFQKALDCFAEALPLDRQAGVAEGEGWALSMSGEVHFALGNWERAQEFYEKAWAAYEMVPDSDPHGHAGLLTNLGKLAIARGNWQQGLEFLNRSEPYWKKTGSPPKGAARLSTFRGMAYLQSGATAEAISAFREGGDRFHAAKLPYGEALALHHLGVAQAQANQVEAARESFTQALALRRRIQDQRGEAETCYQLARLDLQAGNLKQARNWIETALQLIETIRETVSDPTLRASHLASVREYYELHADILLRIHAVQPNPELVTLAFETSERARARSLLELLTASKADLHTGLDPVLVQRKKELGQNLQANRSAYLRLLSVRHGPEREAELDRELVDLQREAQEVEEKLAASSPRYATLTQPLSLSAVQALLPGPSAGGQSETALLEYLLCEERSFLWVVTRKEVQAVVLPGRSEIETAVNRFRRSLTMRGNRFLPLKERNTRLMQADREGAKLAVVLSRMLLGPAGPQLAGKRLFIVPDGVLHFLPFAALASPNEKENKSAGGAYPHPLIADFDMTVLPSASVLGFLQTQDSSRTVPTSVAVFADPVFETTDPRLRVKPTRFVPPQPGTNLNPEESRALTVVRAMANEPATVNLRRLPFTRLEAGAIAAAVPPANRLMALDFDASCLTAEKSNLGRYQILHFATHGLIPPQSPELAGLVLSLVKADGTQQDGYLGLPEIYNLSLNAELVVLSACRTGWGKEIKGEGIVGLTRGFLYAGSERVLVSLWDVHDQGTAELMKHFYRFLLVQHLTPAAALRKAQMLMLKNPTWQAPYYWAGFALQGKD
ncbi:MAG: CHAT domain-containing protein [Blastocatellia bacterium]|nr:CHAT domain-containing protein [Blastocatellia bacterium]